MKALVTGGAGFIGGHIVDQLLVKGYEVTILDCLEKPTHEKGKPAYIPPAVNFIEGNILDKQKLKEALEGVSIIFHEAATGGFTDNISKYYEWNTLATAKLWEYIERNRIVLKKFIVASSVAVYGEGKYNCRKCGVKYPLQRTKEQLVKQAWELYCDTCGGILQTLPTDETKPLNPLLHYSQSKYDQEKISLIMGKRTGIPVVALRYFLTYGPRQSPTNPYTGVCSIFTNALYKNEIPKIYEDGQQTRDFVYVEDVAAANLFVLEHDEANNMIFNIGTGKPTTIMTLAQILAEKLGKKAPILASGTFRQGDVRHIYAETKRLESLGFVAKIDLTVGLKKYLQWALAQKKT